MDFMQPNTYTGEHTVAQTDDIMAEEKKKQECRDKCWKDYLKAKKSCKIGKGRLLPSAPT